MTKQELFAEFCLKVYQEIKLKQNPETFSKNMYRIVREAKKFIFHASKCARSGQVAQESKMAMNTIAYKYGAWVHVNEQEFTIWLVFPPDFTCNMAEYCKKNHELGVKVPT